MSAKALTLKKEERISSRTLIEKLFDGGNSRSMTAYPVRIVYLIESQPQEAAVKILVSAPKRNLKRAIDRNRVKRQMREAYRKNKHIVLERIDHTSNTTLALAFIWLDDRLYDSTEVEQRVVSLLERLAEKMKSSLGTKVSIKPSSSQRGKIEIEYYSQDELDRLYEMLLSARS